MRAKNELKFLAEAYDTKLILERVVDGKLMCPEACCGAPVVECTCGSDCPHCNCFMIQKAIKSNGLTDKLLKEFYKMRDPDGDGSWPDDEREEERRKDPNYGEPEFQDTDGEYGEDNEKFDGPGMQWDGIDDEPTSNRELPVGHYEHMVRLTKNHPDDNPWSQSTVQVRKTEPELIQKFLDKGYRIERPEENEEKQKGVDGKACWKGYRREGTKMKGGKRVDNCVKVEDNESYEHKTDALVAAGTTKSEDINKIDLNKWREYPAEDVMKAVYRRYGQELPSVDSYDWAISWDKKIRPWLKEHEGTF